MDLRINETFALYNINRLVLTTEVESLTFIGQCIANIFSEYNQQDETFLSLFISVRRSTCFRRFLRPSSGAQKLHIQRQVFVRSLLLPAASRPGTVGEVFELLMMDGKPV